MIWVSHFIKCICLLRPPAKLISAKAQVDNLNKAHRTASDNSMWALVIDCIHCPAKYMRHMSKKFYIYIYKMIRKSGQCAKPEQSIEIPPQSTLSFDNKEGHSCKLCIMSSPLQYQNCVLISQIP